MTYYVTCVDTFLSNWGIAKNMTDRLVLKCESYTEALIVKDNAENRTDMSAVEILEELPHYDDHVHVSYHDSSDYSAWYKQGYFERQLN